MGPIGDAIFLTKGVGRHSEKLTSFELALRDARMAEFNLVRVSSIFPPGCKVIPMQEGLKHLKPGQIVYAVMYDNADQRTASPGRVVRRPRHPGRQGSVRLPVGAQELRRDRPESRRLCRGPRGHDARHHPGRRLRSQRQLRRAQGHLESVGQDRHHPQRHAVGDRRSRRAVDLGRGGRGVRQPAQAQVEPAAKSGSAADFC